MKTIRTDPHRPTAIIPADYTYELSFWYGTAECPEGYGLRDLAKLEEQYPRFRNVDHSCDVCGASFSYGGAFVHKPTGQTVLVGGDCASKYAMLINFAEFSAAKEAGKRATAAALTKSRNKRLYEAFLAQNPGLYEALMLNHRISMDLDTKLMHFHSLSSAQIALAFRLLSQAYCPARPVDTNVPAPEGRQKVRGTIISVKDQEGDFGVSRKMTVKVSTDAGTWLAWGTVPASLLEAAQTWRNGTQVLKGAEVEFTATLKRGRDAHFALFSRPTGAKLVAGLVTCAKEAAPHHVDAGHTCVQAFVAGPELEPRPGVAGVVCEQMNAGER